MKKYLIVIEKTKTGFSAFSPDIPGCVATGKSEEETMRNMHNSLEFHISALQAAGEKIPEAHSISEYCSIGA